MDREYWALLLRFLIFLPLFLLSANYVGVCANSKEPASSSVVDQDSSVWQDGIGTHRIHHPLSYNARHHRHDFPGMGRTDRRKRFVVEGISSLASVLVVVDLIINWSAGGNSFNIRQAFQELSDQLAAVEKSLAGIIKEQGMYRDYFEHEAKIINCFNRAKAFYSVGNRTDGPMKEAFLSAAKDLDGSINIIFNGLLKTIRTGTDILSVIKDVNECHARNFEKGAEMCLTLVRIGVSTLFLYHDTVGYPQDGRKYWNNHFLELENKTIARIASITDECRNDEGNVANHMKSIMKSDTSIIRVADKLYDFLTDKYESKEWYIVVYEGHCDTPGSERVDPAFHYVSCIGTGLNALAMSFNKSCSIFDPVSSSTLYSDLFDNGIRSYCYSDAYYLSHHSRYWANGFHPIGWFLSFYPHPTCSIYRADSIYDGLKQGYGARPEALQRASLAVVIDPSWAREYKPNEAKFIQTRKSSGFLTLQLHQDYGATVFAFPYCDEYKRH